MVTVHGEVRARLVCGLCRLLGPLSARAMDSVLKSSVQIRVASLLVFVYGELLPFQACPLPKHRPLCAVCGQVEGRCSGREPRGLGVSMLRWIVSGTKAVWDQVPHMLQSYRG